MTSPARTTAPAKPETIPGDTSCDAGGHNGIRCPLCRWQPRPEDRWVCDCRHLWNTFDTGGVCPGCLKQWTMTKCLSCHRWSAHSDWYPKS
jgi:hypothetical protein